MPRVFPWLFFAYLIAVGVGLWLLGVEPGLAALLAVPAGFLVPVALFLIPAHFKGTQSFIDWVASVTFADITRSISALAQNWRAILGAMLILVLLGQCVGDRRDEDCRPSRYRDC